MKKLGWQEKVASVVCVWRKEETEEEDKPINGWYTHQRTKVVTQNCSNLQGCCTLFASVVLLFNIFYPFNVRLDAICFYCTTNERQCKLSIFTCTRKKHKRTFGNATGIGYVKHKFSFIFPCSHCCSCASYGIVVNHLITFWICIGVGLRNWVSK